ncbi:MAG TPA: LysR substrate-binding domain-containing protein [Pseudonocardia sp.]|jgi:DNA-binding transcriptional LysR family regulator|nr:LysR substrate-binding domain-containing protein [Pseudonocardia sp.]
MELRQLEYFVAVVEEANFTRAAARVHVAQPGVSAQIRRLERELGQPLLDRSNRSVRLTQTGEAVLPFARAALEAVAGARAAVDELAGLVRGHVAVGAVTAHNVDLPAVLAQLHRDHPAVDITLTADTSDRLISAVRGGELDAAIIAYGDPPAGLRLRVVADEAITAAVAHSDVWADRDSVPLTALRDRVLISLAEGAGIRAIFTEACAASGFTPRIGYEAGNPQALAELAALGLGVAILPASVATGHPDLHRVRIDGPELRGRLALAWRAEAAVSPAARALIERALRLLPPVDPTD